MAHRSIGQERFGFAGRARSTSSLDELGKLIDWEPVSVLLASLYSANKGEPAWAPLAMFKALLLSIWYDLSDVKLAEALDDRASFRRFCGFSGTEATPERTAFVRFRKELVAHQLDRQLFTTVTAQLTSKAVFAGCVVLSGVILSLTVHPWWIALTAFAGLNMIQASFTGFCPAAMIFKAFGVRPGTAFK